ncbi:MAG: hypothetical protein HKO79_13410 [Desulfobacterales bacterium]|nr:hypothetical protein [Deltaproteobacteria bacterium]NNL43480.1 hypothetical protein [Desulfobacterales bacterium]
MMKPVKFDIKKDLAPIPFDDNVCQLALKMKESGLVWHPHVGCFAWDPNSVITSESPFPNRVYFVLSLPRFVDILGSVGEISEKLVWLPTWHQARLLCQAMDITDDQEALPGSDLRCLPGEDITRIYRRIIDRLEATKS